ncbi:hypothetical protein ACV229_00180 [Burkholderia sp. MR1-5-21]
MSLVTLILLFGGYVALDQFCKADPVCRAQDGSGVQSVIVDLPSAADFAVLSREPSTPAPPAFSLGSSDEARLADAGDGGPSASQDAEQGAGRMVEGTEPADARRATIASKPTDLHAARPCANRAESGCARPHGGAIRTAGLQGGHEMPHHYHAIRRASGHTDGVRRLASNDVDTAKLYRGH